MAKKCMIERDLKRSKLAKSQKNKRAKLKAVVMNRAASPEERWEATLKLSTLTRNGAQIRMRRRCRLTGRPRGNFRKFGLCRNMLRSLASKGEIPGVVKASW